MKEDEKLIDEIDYFIRGMRMNVGNERIPVEILLMRAREQLLELSAQLRHWKQVVSELADPYA